MTAFETYSTYLALKKHFSDSKYDYHKYRGKIRSSISSFEKRSDKFFFEKLAKKSDVKSFLVANLSEDPGLWIKDLLSAESEKRYVSWLKRQQSLSYIFREDLQNLDPEFNRNFCCRANDHPVLLKKFLAREVSIETIAILLDITGAVSHWDSSMGADPVWLSVRSRVAKYSPFISFDRDGMKSNCLKFFSS